MAAPVVFKATWFTHYTGGGFSFSHYSTAAGYSAVKDAAARLADAYLACCGSAVTMDYIRVSQEGIRGDAVVDADLRGTGDPDLVQVPGAPPRIKPIDDDTPDLWWTAALLRLGATPAIYGRQFMRGIPDNIATTPERGIANDLFKKAVDKFLKVLTDDAWGMMAVPRSATNQVPIKLITTAQNGDVTIETNGNHNIAVGADFRWSQFGPQRAAISPNGKWVADQGTATNIITVLAYQGMLVPSKYRRMGSVWSLTRTFAAYSLPLCTLIRTTRRKAGRPFGSLAGKLKTKQLA